MENGIFFNPTKIIFGRGTEMQLGAEVANYADRVLLHYGGASAEKSGLLARLRKSLKDAGVDYYELGGVKPNPRLSLVYEGIKLCREKSIGFVVAVGGGSVIDSAKAIACGTPASEDIWEYFTKGLEVKTALPVAAVLTIPGAGSESSNSTVLTNEDTMEKLALGSEKVRPILSILNPELTASVPRANMASGVADAFTHVLERYFTKSRYVDVTDRMSEGIMKSLIKYGKKALDEPDNYDVRAEVMWACKMAHDGTLGMGRIEDWASHRIEHELSAKYDIAHGAGLAIIYPAWMKYVSREDKAKFIQFATRVFDIDFDYNDPDATIFAGIDALVAYFKSLGLATSMKEAGLTDGSDLEELAKSCMENNGGSTGRFEKLYYDDVLAIYRIALDQN